MWARSVGLTTTVGLEMSVVFLTNVLIVAARVVLQTQTVVPDIAVVRKDTGMLVNSVSVVSIVLGNLVVRTVTVVDQKNAVFLINVLIMVVHVLQIQIAVPDSTVVKDDTRMSYLSVVQTVLENLVDNCGGSGETCDSDHRCAVNQNSNSLPSWMIAVITVSLVVFLIAIGLVLAVFWYVKKKRPANATQAGTVPLQNTPYQGTEIQNQQPNTQFSGFNNPTTFQNHPQHGNNVDQRS